MHWGGRVAIGDVNSRAGEGVEVGCFEVGVDSGGADVWPTMVVSINEDDVGTLVGFCGG